MLVCGVVTVEAGASAVTGEAHPASPDLLGKLVPTDRLQDMGATLEVTHSESGELLSLDANGEGDYRRVPGRIILKSAEAAEAGTLTFAYTAHKAARIQAMLRQGFESDLFFDGQNEATGGRWVGRFYRVRWSPSESVDLIGEDFAISGEVLADESRDGTTVSRFYDLSIGESFL